MCDLISCGSQPQTEARLAVTAAQRRAFLQGVISLPLATVLAHPMLAKAAGDKLSPVTVKTPNGDTGRGVIALPAKTPAPAVLLIHEWWGLNDQIKAVAAEFAKEGYVALAVDLYGGKVATTRDEAQALMKAVDTTRATEELVTWVKWLQKHKNTSGSVGTIGWCFGGGWSLKVSLATRVAATVIYYGNVQKNSEQLHTLWSPVLGHFATRDEWINRKMVSGFEQAMTRAGKNLTVHWYEADHAFANPTGGRYDADDAKLAWSRTLAFLQEHLVGPHRPTPKTLSQ